MSINGFVCYAPIYGRNSAGVYCLYKLMSDILSLGYDTFITVENNLVSPYKNVFGVPVISNQQAIQLINDFKMVAVYSEGVPGNPLNSKNVMRWYLNRAPLVDGKDRVYEEFEHIYSYDKNFNRFLKNKVDGQLYLPTIDVDLFKYDPNIEKTDITVYTGKNGFKNNYIDRYDNLILRYKPDHNTVAQILKKTKILYSFDCTTILVHEALYAGCNVILIDDGTQTHDTIKTNILGSYGISWYGENSDLYKPEDIYNSVNEKYTNVLNNYNVELKTMVKNMLITKINNEI